MVSCLAAGIISSVLPAEQKREPVVRRLWAEYASGPCAGDYRLAARLCSRYVPGKEMPAGYEGDLQSRAGDDDGTVFSYVCLYVYQDGGGSAGVSRGHYKGSAGTGEPGASDGRRDSNPEAAGAGLQRGG